MADVTGVGFADDTRDLLVARLNDLVTDSASDDPNIEYVYDRHWRSRVQLNAASVDVESATQRAQGTDASGGTSQTWIMTFTVRVHTGRMGYPVDGRETMRLMESIANQLWAEFVLDANTHINATPVLQNNQAFEESRTVGGVVYVEVIRNVDYIQE